MEGYNPIWLLLGAFGVVCAIGLSFVKVEKAALGEKRHSNPGLALFRFPIWRWFVVSISLLFGMFFIAAGFGMVQL